MNTREFLEILLPASGYATLAVPRSSGGFIQFFYGEGEKEFAALVAKAYALDAQNKDVYFALSTNTEKSRKGETALALKSLFLDFDIGTDPKKAGKSYATRAEGLDAITRLAGLLGLPTPMVINSGGGWHAYWPFTDEVPADQWLPVARRFKAICLAENIRIDPAVPADRVRVLRVLGTRNHKLLNNPRPVELEYEGDGPTEFSVLQKILEQYEVDLPVEAGTFHGNAFDADSNIGPSGSPADFAPIVFGCAVLGSQAACGGVGIEEPLWWASLGVALHTTTPAEAGHILSHQHPEYDHDKMLAKMRRWKAGPTTCAYFRDHLSCSECSSCKLTLTSPIQLGHTDTNATSKPAPGLVQDRYTGEFVEVEPPGLPEPYRSVPRPGGGEYIVINMENRKSGAPEQLLICPAGLYPINILRHSRLSQTYEATEWLVRIPNVRPTLYQINQSLIGNSRELLAYLHNVGVYVDPANIKDVQSYMSKFLRTLAEQRERQKVFNHLGWQEDPDRPGIKTGYVVGNRLFNMDGTISPCHITQGVRNATKDKLVKQGSLAAWSQWINKHYGDPGYEAHRFILYCSLAAPLFHMTGEYGALITASGRSGCGKTTAVRAGSSIWGHPDALLLNGNPQGATMNAVENQLGINHSMVLMYDDTTELGTKQVANFALNISQGVGKQRMKGSEHDGKVVGWNTLVCATTNVDDVAQYLSQHTKTDAHMMRILSIPFDLVLDSGGAAVEAERFKRGMVENYGAACEPYMQYVTSHYAEVMRRVQEAEDKAWLRVGTKGAERFWVKIGASMRVAQEIAWDLELFDFPIDADYEWFFNHITWLRGFHAEHKSTPAEDLTSFIHKVISEEALVLSSTASNINNILKSPTRQLSIRIECDNSTVYLSRNRVMEYCGKSGFSIRDWENALVAQGIITNKNKQKTLGAGTAYAVGQMRCWEIDAEKLGSEFIAGLRAGLSPTPPASNNPSNVVPISRTTRLQTGDDV